MLRINNAYGQLSEFLTDYMARHIKRHRLAIREFADSEFGGDFPGGSRADHNVIGRVRNDAACSFRKPVAIRKPPEKSVSVQ